jgi:DNA-binding Xre family transcriptional regulator
VSPASNFKYQVQAENNTYQPIQSSIKQVDTGLFSMYHCVMNTPMFIITLDEAVKARGVTLYGVARDSRVPYNTLLRLVQYKGKQSSIDLSVLSRLCTTLGCTPNDLLKYVPDSDDEAIRLTLRGRDETPKRGRPRKEKGAEKK